MSSYIIEPKELVGFLENNNIRLPRFQRKATWDDKQKFELCISVFQDYPVGVVILNEVNNIFWLLDGRQRREALTIMRENPVELYNWARTYISFKKNAADDEIIHAYWNKVERFLQTEEKQSDEKKSETSEDDINIYSDDEEEPVQDSFDSLSQQNGLQTLLDIILMVHRSWIRIFDYQKYIQKLTYAPTKNGGQVDPILLRKFLIDLISTTKKEYEGKFTIENFINFYNEKFVINDEKSFEKCVVRYWEAIEKSLKVIDASENIFAAARIGIIRLTNASPLDAQNIFSRINRGGTQLKAEELLSAKPYWNIAVNNPSTALQELVKGMYSKLGIPMPENVCRWDVAATLISRIDKEHLIFDSYKESKEKKEISMDEITLGFKLLSSIYRGGMSNKHVVELETERSIHWDKSDIDDLIYAINSVCELLMDIPFFKLLLSWKKPIAKLLGNAIALEFITIMWLDWKHNDQPRSGGKYKALQRDAKILFDRLVFEYATRGWRGSGDSKMASDIKNWEKRLEPIDQKAWTEFVNGACCGNYNGQNTSKKSLNPVLHYYYVLKGVSPTLEGDTKFEVDHIYPEEKFQGNKMANQGLKDSLINFALLPKRDNISKGSKELKEITNVWLREQISRFAEIAQKDFEKYSDINNIDDLKKKRKKLFETVFSENRTTELSN